jgi:hypothetical protein
LSLMQPSTPAFVSSGKFTIRNRRRAAEGIFKQPRGKEDHS